MNPLTGPVPLATSRRNAGIVELRSIRIEGSQKITGAGSRTALASPGASLISRKMPATWTGAIKGWIAARNHPLPEPAQPLVIGARDRVRRHLAIPDPFIE